MNHRKRRLKKLLVESELARISVVDEILPTFDSAGARNQGAGSRPVSESCGNADTRFGTPRVWLRDRTCAISLVDTLVPFVHAERCSCRNMALTILSSARILTISSERDVFRDLGRGFVSLLGFMVVPLRAIIPAFVIMQPEQHNVACNDLGPVPLTPALPVFPA
jgi:hypothetical protein